MDFVGWISVGDILLWDMSFLRCGLGTKLIHYLESRLSEWTVFASQCKVKNLTLRQSGMNMSHRLQSTHSLIAIHGRPTLKACRKVGQEDLNTYIYF